MNRSEFEKLLERYVTGQVSEQEKIKIEAWLEVMKTEEITELDLSDRDQENLFKKISSTTTGLKEIVEFRPGAAVFRGSWKLAAAILLLVALSFAVWLGAGYYKNPQPSISDVSVRKVILSDGTLAWLKGASDISYSEKDGMRHAWFEGEALFEVAKDARRPFIIHWKGTTLKVLGTSFNLRAANDTLELKVLTGRVHFQPELASAGVDVSPNEKILFHSQPDVAVVPMAAAESLPLTTHTEYNMQFSNATLTGVAERLEKKFDVTIRFKSQRIGSCSITADLTDRSLATSLEMLSEVLDIQYEQKEKTITITGNGCNNQ